MKKPVIIILCFAFAPFLSLAQKTSVTTPIVVGPEIAIVQTEQGKVRGYIHNGTYTYKGIPYAKAERFQAPV
ncbi:MAG: carboxylesterase, partial [Marivirga sp.]|nr:carboxylesterase [Marivirga sp.]